MVGPNEPDGDCKPGGIILAAATTTLAATATTVAVVTWVLTLTSSLGATAAAPVVGTASATTVASSVAGSAPGGGLSVQTEPSAALAEEPLPVPKASASMPPVVMRGQAALTLLKNAKLVEGVAGRPGVYRPRPGFDRHWIESERSTGITGIAYIVEPDGTLRPDVAVATQGEQPAVVSGTPSGAGSVEVVASPSAQPPLDRLGATITGIPDEVRQAIIELMNPAKLMGMKFDDIERFREAYENAKAIENPIVAKYAQDQVIEAFVKEFSFSPEAARGLLELSEAKWNAVATLISGLG